MKSVLRKIQWVLVLLPLSAMSQWSSLAETIQSPTPPGSYNTARFGEKIALSQDGTVMVVAAPSSGLLQDGNSYAQAYRLVSGAWVALGSSFEGVSTSEEYSENKVGVSVGLSADGTILAVGEQHWERDNGRVRVFRNVGDQWIQIGNDIAAVGSYDFGSVFALSSDGNSIAINTIMDAFNAGVVTVFHNVSDTWVQKGSAIEGAEMLGGLGSQMSISGDGSKLALSQVEGFFTARIVVYDFENADWQLTATLDGSVPYLSADGTKLAIGDYMYSGSESQSGIARIYALTDNNWVEEFAFEPETPVSSGRFGQTVSMSADASVIAIGTDSNGRTVAVYQKANNQWQLTGEFFTDEQMTGTMTPALSADGNTLAIGKQFRDSDADVNNLIFERSVATYANDFLSTNDRGQQRFAYYPNPVKEMLNFSMEANNIQSVEVYDLAARIIVKQTANGQELRQISLAGVPAGVYSVKVQTTSGIKTFKIVKQ